MKSAITTATWQVTLDAKAEEPSLRNTAIAGVLAVTIGFGGFLGWAFTANLDSAALAVGTVIVESQRKTVSHLEGGILSELLVRDGDLVEAGQVLLRLDATQSQALVAQISGHYWGSLARHARLLAEQANATTIDFPAELVEAARTTDVARAAITNERYLFKTRLDSHESQIAIQRKKIAQLNGEIRALEAQRDAASERLRYTEDELNTVEKLLAKGYERKPRLLELQRSAAEIRGRVGELAANKSQAEQGIAAAELEIINLENTRRSEISDELQTVQITIAELAEKLRGASDILKRHEVRAPQAGRVTGLKFFTKGGVIPPGAPILDIVPENDEMIVEARVSPVDIDDVTVGQAATVRLTSYRQRLMPPVPGEVIMVSADRFQDERTGTPYFGARVRLDPEALQSLPEIELHPGMPAEVMIKGKARKAIDYFLSPITDSMRRAFRED